MQDVGCDDQIERVRIEALLEGVVLDIEGPELRERIPREPMLSVRREAGRDIGEYVFGAMFRQDGKDKAGRPAGSSADFQNSQRPSFRQASSGLDDRFLNQEVVEAKCWRILIESLRSGDSAFGEDEVQRIEVAP